MGENHFGMILKIRVISMVTCSVGTVQNCADLCKTMQKCGELRRTVQNRAEVWITVQNCGELCRTVQNRAEPCRSVENCGELCRTVQKCG